jgi:hypothetical protein
VFDDTGTATVFNYLPPQVTDIGPKPYDAYGNVLLTIFGYNFGEAGVESQVNITIDNGVCKNIRWNRDNTGCVGGGGVSWS